MSGRRVINVTLPRGGTYRVRFHGESPTSVETRVQNWGNPYWRTIWDADGRSSPSPRVTCVLRSAIHTMQQGQ